MSWFYKMMKKDSKGFTLVELMVVLLILGILVAIAIPIYNRTQENARTSACQANLRTIDGAAAQFRAEDPNGAWPTDVDALVAGEYLKTAPTCPSDGDAYTIVDGVATCPNGHTYP